MWARTCTVFQATSRGQQSQSTMQRLQIQAPNPRAENGATIAHSAHSSRRRAVAAHGAQDRTAKRGAAATPVLPANASGATASCARISPGTHLRSLHQHIRPGPLSHRLRCQSLHPVHHRLQSHPFLRIHLHPLCRHRTRHPHLHRHGHHRHHPLYLQLPRRSHRRRCLPCCLPRRLPPTTCSRRSPRVQACALIGGSSAWRQAR